MCGRPAACIVISGKELCSGKTCLSWVLDGFDRTRRRAMSYVSILPTEILEVSLIETMWKLMHHQNAPAQLHLDWGKERAEEAKKAGTVVERGYDIILAAQVVYVPDAIKPLVETIATLLGESRTQNAFCNDAVTCTATQAECRALLDAALSAHGLQQEPALGTGKLSTTRGDPKPGFFRVVR